MVSNVVIHLTSVERGSSAVECRNRNRESPVSKLGHFRSLHDASVHSAV